MDLESVAPTRAEVMTTARCALAVIGHQVPTCRRAGLGSTIQLFREAALGGDDAFNKCEQALHELFLWRNANQDLHVDHHYAAIERGWVK